MRKKISFVMIVLCLVLLHNRAIDITFAEEEINQTQAASGSALTMQTATGSALGVAVISEESTNIASGTSYGMDWVLDAEGTLTITGVCDEIGSTRPEYGWQDYLEEIKKVHIDAAVGTAFYRAFADAVNLTEVTYGPNFDSSGLWVYESATLVDVFGNTGLETIDFSMWDFSEFEDLGNLFGYASYPNTKHVSFAGCDFSHVTDMSAMFYEMDTFESIDLRGCTLGNLQTVQNMFSACTSLKEVYLDGLVNAGVTKMIGMFRDCSSLEYISMNGWDTSGATSMDYMFNNCTSLVSLDLSSWNTDNVTSMNLMFTGCSRLTELDVSGWNTTGITQLGQKTNYASSSYGMFEGCSSLKYLDLSGWDVSNVTTLYRMVAGCTSLERIDMSGWNTASLKNMYEVFAGCASLKEVDISHFDTSKVTTMVSLFSSCTSLEDVTFGAIDTSAVTDMSYLFSGCTSLETVDLSGFNTSNVEDMYGMFTGCTGMRYLDISNFDMGKVAANDRNAMFYNCTSMDVLLLPSGDANYPAQKYYRFSFNECFPNRIYMPALSKSQFHYASDGTDVRYGLYEDDTMTVDSDGYAEGLYSKIHRVYVTGNYFDEYGNLIHSIEPKVVLQQVLCETDDTYNRDIAISNIDLSAYDFDYETDDYKWTFNGELTVLPTGADYATYNNEVDTATENIHRVSDEYSYVYALKFERTSKEVKPSYTVVLPAYIVMEAVSTELFAAVPYSVNYVLPENAIIVISIPMDCVMENEYGETLGIIADKYSGSWASDTAGITVEEDGTLTGTDVFRLSAPIKAGAWEGNLQVKIEVVTGANE